ncbi:hypothetical protein WMF39_27280 [Sorangium sp. So ce1504]|uniref:hypothetical protein n=1 Tax=Sorangium sp. So ce1504 TaxID=3133337 RepID=UPI003F5E2ED4
MPSERQVFDLLSRDELAELVGRCDPLVQEGRSEAQLADALVGRGRFCGAEPRPEVLRDETSRRGFERLHALPRLPERLDLRTENVVHALQGRRAADAHVEQR